MNTISDLNENDFKKKEIKLSTQNHLRGSPNKNNSQNQ